MTKIIRHSLARQTGRTNAGLANQLNGGKMGRKHQPFGQSAAAVKTRLRLRRQLRVLW